MLHFSQWRRVRLITNKTATHNHNPEPTHLSLYDHLGGVYPRVRPVGAPPQPLQLRPDLLLRRRRGVLLCRADLLRPLAEGEPARLAHVGVAEAGADGAEGEEGALQVLVEVEGEPLVPQAVVVGQVEILSSK